MFVNLETIVFHAFRTSGHSTPGDDVYFYIDAYNS